MNFRLFAALSVPYDVKLRLTATQRTLQKSLLNAVILWTRPQDFHLTLRFLGDVEELRVGDLEAALQAACAPLDPFEVVCERIGQFSSQKTPRVIWAGLRGDGLAPLQRAVETACAPFAERPRFGNFNAHITLGRVHHISHAERQIFDWVIQNSVALNFGTWTATQVELIRTEFEPGPANYTTLSHFPLSSLHSAKIEESRGR